MVNLIGNFSRLTPQKVLVAGDLMLDTYTVGKARRISPEAPVAVIQVEREEKLPGGAGNTLLNLISMGAQVTLLGRIGNDISGSTLKTLLESEGADTNGLFVDPSYMTPIKNRIVSDNQQIVRVDHEKNTLIEKELEAAVIAKIPSLLQGVKVVAISDYGKGFLTPLILKTLIAEARKNNIYVIADPKGTDFSRYSGVNLIKPNLGEAFAAAKVAKEAGIDQAARAIFDQLQVDSLMVTRSEEGISLFQRGRERLDFPVHAKQVKDVTGAGDTVLAMLAMALANDISLEHAIPLANVAAGIAIERFGCARVSLEDLAKRLLELDASNKVFDKEHLNVLKAALGKTAPLLIKISSQSEMTPELIHSLSLRKKEKELPILVFLEGSSHLESTVGMLVALKPIDFILINTPLDALLSYFPNSCFERTRS